jgi:hypothetical protein
VSASPNTAATSRLGSPRQRPTCQPCGGKAGAPETLAGSICIAKILSSEADSRLCIWTLYRIINRDQEEYYIKSIDIYILFIINNLWE